MLVYWIWFSLIPERFTREKLLLLERFRDPEELYHCQRGNLPDMPEALGDYIEEKDLTEAQRILDDCVCKNISILTYGDGSYPRKLKNISDPPMVLYYKGRLPDWESVPVIGIVGTRKASAYGIKNGRRFGGEIAASGALVVSGAASGIDGAAMRGAMEQGRPVVGVLGNGVDVVYPPVNRKLYAETEKFGCLISEYIPGTPPYRGNFPRRNRIISGMSDGVLVVESPERSGALITATMAGEQGRDVFVIPGNIDTPTCQGSNRLLRNGGTAVFSGWDVLEEYADRYPGRVRPAEAVCPPEAADDKKTVDNPKKSGYSDRVRPQTPLSEQEERVYRCLTEQPQLVDGVISQTGLSAAEVLRILTKLSIKGMVKNHPGRQISRK